MPRPGSILAASWPAQPALHLTAQLRGDPARGRREQGWGDTVSRTGKQTQGRRARERNPGFHRETTQSHGHRHTHTPEHTPHAHTRTHTPHSPSQRPREQIQLQRDRSSERGKPEGNTERRGANTEGQNQKKIICKHFWALNQLFSPESTLLPGGPQAMPKATFDGHS